MTTAALPVFANKILDFSILVKKADFDAKISEVEKKIFTTSDYN